MTLPLRNPENNSTNNGQLGSLVDLQKRWIEIGNKIFLK